MTTQELTQEFEAARTWAQTLQTRNADPATVQAALNKALLLKQRLDQARGDASFSSSLHAITGGTSGASGGRGGQSIGQEILNSEMGQWLLKNRGSLPTGTWTSPSSELMAATLTSDGASGGDLVLADYQPGIQPLPTRELTVADLLAPGTTDSNAVGYMMETAFTNASAAVAEGAPKPESTLVFDAVVEPVRKLAHWIPVTDEMLEDVSALRGYLDARLRHFIGLTEDDQLLNGDGVAPNFRGLRTRALAPPIARVTEPTPDAILTQISAIEASTLLAVDGIILHPSNWNKLLLLKDAAGAYLAGGGPFAAPQRKTLWGRAVAVTPAIPINTALVGAFKTGGAQYFRRGALRVEASNSHADFWTRNMVAIRAELRGALACYRPAAFGVVTNLN